MGGLVEGDDGLLRWKSDYPVNADGFLILTPKEEADLVRNSKKALERDPEYRDERVRRASESEVHELHVEQELDAQLKDWSDAQIAAWEAGVPQT